MSLHFMEKSQLTPFVERLLAQSEVIGPMQEKGFCVFGPIQTPNDLSLNYTTTILPPKKLLFPQEESLFKFTLGESPEVEPIIDERPRILFGVHPCDLWAIWEMDQVFGDKHPDNHYLKRREAALLVGWECTEPDERCFCKSVATSTIEEGCCDLFFTDVGQGYAVQVGSEKGNRLIEGDPAFQPARSDILLQIQQAQQRKADRITAGLAMDVNRLPLFLDAVYDSPVWQQEGERCSSCGSCVMVCPTCFCFDVKDHVALDLSTGERVRVWDGCVQKDFTLIASGESFREERSTRLRHRMYRKFQYLMTQYGKSFCVGCGRCSRECLVDIHPVGVVEQLVAQHMEEGV